MKLIKKLILKNKYKMVTKNLTPGTKLVVVDNKAGHGIPIGTKITSRDVITQSGGPEGVYCNEYSVFFYLSDVRLDSYTIEDMEKELESASEEVKKAQSKVENIKHKIEFIKETGVTSFDDNEFKAYCTLKTLENSELSTLEKAKQIASLFNK